MTSSSDDGRIEMILNDLRYLRGKLDTMEQRLQGIIWKVAGIGAGSAALGYLATLLLGKGLH